MPLLYCSISLLSVELLRLLFLNFSSIIKRLLIDLLSLLLKQTANQSSGLYTLAYFILHIATSHRLELSLKEKKNNKSSLSPTEGVQIP